MTNALSLSQVTRTAADFSSLVTAITAEGLVRAHPRAENVTDPAWGGGQGTPGTAMPALPAAGWLEWIFPASDMERCAALQAFVDRVRALPIASVRVQPLPLPNRPRAPRVIA